MKLEDIGFYTLSDRRAAGSSAESPLWRCELVLTEICNFKCTYCRGLINPQAKGTIPLQDAKKVVKYWISEGLRNVRFTGGEPTLYRGLEGLVSLCRDGGVEHIAISTNGSASKNTYQALINAGVNDFSISLDSGCCSIGEVMSGGANKWSTVIENIGFIAKQTHVTVGMVFTEDNIDRCLEEVAFADSLGVADIRVIPSAQFNVALTKLQNLPTNILDKYPILKYRIANLVSGRHVRGLRPGDSKRCWLAMDDMACAQGNHYPCIIYLREGGNPIGKVTKSTRKDRMNWLLQHDCFNDKICKNNCLDVCVDFNNKASQTAKKRLPIVGQPGTMTIQEDACSI